MYLFAVIAYDTFPYRSCAKLFRSSAPKNDVTFLLRKYSNFRNLSTTAEHRGLFCAEHCVPLLFRFVTQKVKIWN